ncbi:MAG: alpha/beta fold hydrolase [Thermodesulfobacteriota bacterium]
MEIIPPFTQKIAIDCLLHRPCVELAYGDYGAGEALILIHGLGGRGWSWRQQIAELSQDYRVLALDLRGHGNSGCRAGETISLRSLAEDVMALMKNLGVVRGHICGHSLGGMIALEILARSGTLIKSLVLTDTTAFFPPPSMLAEFLHHFDLMEMANWARFMAPRLLGREAPAALTEEVVETISATSRVAYRQALIAAFQADYRWLLPLLDLPTLILVGEEDQATPWGHARYLQSRIREASLQVVPKAGHLSPQENPQEFNRQLRAHLKGYER